MSKDLEMLLSVFKMVRVGRRPCPNFPGHCFYILTNPQISMATDKEAKVDKIDLIP
jgi:hypothetical protein